MNKDDALPHRCSHSVYHLHCIKCCARLVMSARPSRKHQESMLAHCERYHRRDLIIEEIKRCSS
jgi:hypothetical protein